MQDLYIILLAILFGCITGITLFVAIFKSFADVFVSDLRCSETAVNNLKDEVHTLIGIIGSWQATIIKDSKVI